LAGKEQQKRGELAVPWDEKTKEGCEKARKRGRVSVNVSKGKHNKTRRQEKSWAWAQGRMGVPAVGGGCGPGTKDSQPKKSKLETGSFKKARVGCLCWETSKTNQGSTKKKVRKLAQKNERK